MCEPTTALMAAGLVAGLMGQVQAASSQKHAATASARAAQESADASAAAQNEQVNVRLRQEAEKTSDEGFERRRRAIQAQATALVAGGERGVGGLSLDNILADIARNEAFGSSRANQNLQFQFQQAQAQRLGIAAQRQSRINAAAPGPIAQPDFIGTALQIGTLFAGSGGGSGANPNLSADTTPF